MIGVRQAAATRARAVGLALIAQVALGACTQTFTEQTVKSPVRDRRTRVDASDPLVRSEWRITDGKLVGHMTWASCIERRAWTVEERRVKHQRPIPAAP